MVVVAYRAVVVAMREDLFAAAEDALHHLGRQHVAGRALALDAAVLQAQHPCRLLQD